LVLRFNHLEVDLVKLVKFTVGVGTYEECAIKPGVPKPVLIVVLVQRLAAQRDPPGDSYQNSGLVEPVRRVVKVVPPGDGYNVGVFRGATRLTVRVPRQTIWKRATPGAS